MLLTRRSLLAGASLAAAPNPAWARNFLRGAFTHGIASGDPTASSVILWTRFAPDAGEARIGWEVSEQENFSRITQRGALAPNGANDFCAKVDVRDLRPNTRYFYRFLSASGPSVTGLTRTAPREHAQSLSVAFFSCANLPFGYFHAYADAAAREDIDLCLHLGDYIYELPRGAYPSSADTIAGRVIEPSGETIRLADYYARYASYHLDADLQELRRLKPLCVIFDDHEIANDPWMRGAQNHQEDTEGSWVNRVAVAVKSYYDWMPIRPRRRNAPYLQRSLDWGDLARIVFLDTRLSGRDLQLEYGRDFLNALDGPIADAALQEFRAQLNDPSRQMLGARQEAWLAEQLRDSRRRGQIWQVLAQQVETGQKIAAPGISNLLSAPAAPNNWFAVAERVAQFGLPWNLDAWDGYPAARERLLRICAADSANTLLLAGDSHNVWARNLAAPDQHGRRSALEFAGGSVTSPGYEKSLVNAQPGEAEALMRSANPSLAFTDLATRGYGAFTLTREGCAAEWRAVSDIRSPTRSAASAARFSAAASNTGGPGAWTI